MRGIALPKHSLVSCDVTNSLAAVFETSLPENWPIAKNPQTLFRCKIHIQGLSYRLWLILTCMYLLHKLAQFYNDLLIADSLRFPPSQAMKLTCIASHVCLHLFVRSLYCATANLMTLCQTIRAFCCCHSVPVCWNGFFGHIYWSCQSRQLMKKLAFTGTVWMALLSKLLQVKFKMRYLYIVEFLAC